MSLPKLFESCQKATSALVANEVPHSLLGFFTFLCLYPNLPLMMNNMNELPELLEGGQNAAGALVANEVPLSPFLHFSFVSAPMCNQ